MDITIKCPNCYQQVSKDNRFCIFCGYDLEKASSAVKGDSVSIGADTSGTDSPFYDGPRFCPKGHDVPDPSLGFCPTCGSPLVNEPSTKTTSTEEPTRRKSSSRPVITRKCSCGYVCEDPDLNFCPSCGLPFDTSAATDGERWTCTCGNTNSSEMEFCVECGKPKGWHPRKEEGVAHEETHIPDGMEPPKETDLFVKSKYGN